MSARPRAKNASYTPDSTQNSTQFSLPPVPSQNIYSINSYFDFNPQLGTFVPFPIENSPTIREIDNDSANFLKSPKKFWQIKKRHHFLPHCHNQTESQLRSHII